jgi:MFS family permease
VQGSVLFVAARIVSGFAVGLFTGAGTALLTELAPSGQSRRAATHAATASVAGFAIGPVIGGAFAEYLPWPRHLVYGVALVLLVPALLGAVLVRETVADRGRVALRLQRLRMPPERKAFGLAAALAVCAWMSASFFGALGAVMAIRLFDIENRFVATLVVLCFLGSSAVAQMGLRGQPIRRSAVSGSGFLIAGFALIVAGLVTDHFAFFVAGALVGGIGQALSYLAGQSIVERIAPTESRGEVFSTYLVVVYYGGGMTAIALGIVARQIGLEEAAVGYAVILCALTVVTGLLSSRFRLPSRAR